MEPYPPARGMSTTTFIVDYRVRASVKVRARVSVQACDKGLGRGDLGVAREVLGLDLVQKLSELLDLGLLLVLQLDAGLLEDLL